MKDLEMLMKQAQKGDQKAYAQLLLKLTPILRAFVSNKLLGHYDSEDVVQEILLSIHKASHTYHPGYSFKNWFFAIARYRIADHLRSFYADQFNRVNAKMTDIDVDDLMDENNVTKEHENHEQLNRFLQTLPQKQRQVLCMMRIEGHSVKTTAEMLYMSESAVKVTAHRAMKALAHQVLNDTND